MCMKINVNNYAKTGVRHFGRSGFVHAGVLPLNFHSYKLRFWLPLRFIPKAIFAHQCKLSQHRFYNKTIFGMDFFNFFNNYFCISPAKGLVRPAGRSSRALKCVNLVVFKKLWLLNS